MDFVDPQSDEELRASEWPSANLTERDILKWLQMSNERQILGI